MAERLTPENARLDRWMARQAKLELEISDLMARLAEVEALCKRSDEYGHLTGWVKAERVLRAARGKDDQ